MKLPFSFALNRSAAAQRPRTAPIVESDAGETEDGATDVRPDVRAFPAGLSEAPPPGAIGAILVASGRLKIADVQQIVAAQQGADAPFGETAVRLGLASAEDVQFALAKQFALPRVPADCEDIDAEVAAAFHPELELAERMRYLRGQIAVRALERTPPLRTIAVLSSERQVGRTYITANLATVFAQLGARVLVVDADLIRPRLHQLFRMSNRNGLSTVLAGRSKHAGAIVAVERLAGLHVMPSGPIPPNPDDLIARPALGQMLRRLETEFDLVLIDTPCWTDGSGARTIAAAAGSAIQLVQEGQTAAVDASELAHEMASLGSQLIGVVMNRP
jgi:chain length determinant protein tyrosine kinase EpsG